MSYGLYVENADSRIQIDSDSTYANMHIHHEGSITAQGDSGGSAISGSPVNYTYASSDMLFARPASLDGPIMLDKQVYFEVDNMPATVWYFVAKPASYFSIIGDYGLQVYSTAGLVFDSRAMSTSFEVIAAGNLAAGTTSQTINIPSGISMTDVYCLMNSCYSYVTAGPALWYTTHKRYQYVGQSIRVENFVQSGGGPVSFSDFHWIIARKL